jgi:hypothetical protein
MAMGCSWWVVIPTAIVWWLAGRGWGLTVLGVTLAITILAIVVVAPAQARMTREVDQSKSLPGTVRCHRCAGDGWVPHDTYNEVTCPVCNGSGWQDAPRQGPPRMKGT